MVVKKFITSFCILNLGLFAQPIRQENWKVEQCFKAGQNVDVTFC